MPGRRSARGREDGGGARDWDSGELSFEMRAYARNGRFMRDAAERAHRHDGAERAAIRERPAFVAGHERSTPRPLRPARARARALATDHEDLFRHLYHVSARQRRREEQHRFLPVRRRRLDDVGRRLDGARPQMERPREKVAVILPYLGEREVRRAADLGLTPSTHPSLTTPYCREARQPRASGCNARGNTNRRPGPHKRCNPRSRGRCARAWA